MAAEKRFAGAVTHLPEASATAADVARIYLLNGHATVFERELSKGEIEGLGGSEVVKPVTLGKRYKKTTRCKVNGDGYWTWRIELVCEGLIVGSVHLKDGGEL